MLHSFCVLSYSHSHFVCRHNILKWWWHLTTRLVTTLQWTSSIFSDGLKTCFLLTFLGLTCHVSRFLESTCIVSVVVGLSYLEKCTAVFEQCYALWTVWCMTVCSMLRLRVPSQGSHHNYYSRLPNVDSAHVHSLYHSQVTQWSSLSQTDHAQLQHDLIY